MKAFAIIKSGIAIPIAVQSSSLSLSVQKEQPKRLRRAQLVFEMIRDAGDDYAFFEEQ